MNILVINVSLRPQSPVKLFPIGLGYITTAMKNAGYDFDLLDIDAHRYSDDKVKRLMRKKKYDIICMGCIVTGYKIIKKLASVIKEYHPKSVIIAGNSVATSAAETLLRKTKVDIAVMSEGDETIIDLLKAVTGGGSLEDVKGVCFVKDGKLAMTKTRPLIKDISTLPFLNFSIFDIEAYIETSKYEVNDPLPIPRETVRALPINTARGCVGRCNFCYHVFQNMPYRYRTADSIIAEIKSLKGKYGLNYIHFWDELTFFSKKQALELAQKILDSGLHFYWTAHCRANLFNNDEDIEIIKKIKEAGCLGVEYSLESADGEILKAMNKKISVRQFSKQTKIFQKAGVATWTSLVFGYPQETPKTVKKTFDCCIKNKIYPSAGYLLPQPASLMYDYAIKRGFIRDEEEYLMKMGDRQDLRINMTRMKDKEFEKLIKDGLMRCNEELNCGLDPKELIKTLYYRVKKKS